MASHNDALIPGLPAAGADGAFLVVSTALWCSSNAACARECASIHRRLLQPDMFSSSVQDTPVRQVELFLASTEPPSSYSISTQEMRSTADDGDGSMPSADGGELYANHGSVARVFVPDRCAYVMNVRPVVNSRFVKLYKDHQIMWYACFAALCALGGGLGLYSNSNVPKPTQQAPRPLTELLSCTVLAVATGLQLSVYSRQILLTVLQTFDFWFTALHAGILAIWISAVTFDSSQYVLSFALIVARVIAFVCMVTALMGMDAVEARYFIKLILPIFVAIFFFAWGLSWHISSNDYIMSFAGTNFYAREMFRSSAWTVSVFCAKFVKKVMTSGDVMLLSVSLRELHHVAEPHVALVAGKISFHRAEFRGRCELVTVVLGSVIALGATIFVFYVGFRLWGE